MHAIVDQQSMSAHGTRNHVVGRAEWQSIPSRIFPGFLSSLCLLGGFTGCGQQDQIRSYVVERPKTEMLAGVTRREKSVWYFKVTAPQTALEDVHSQIDDFFRTIHWPSKDAIKPTWVLPEGWKEEPASRFREATLTFKNRGLKFEVSVTQLPFIGDDWNKYLLENVNRWRKQLNIDDWTQAELAKESKTIESGEDKILLFDFVGYERPERRVVTQEEVDRLFPKQPSPPKQTIPKLETPAGWEKVPLTQFSVVAFQIREGDKSAIVTLSPLPPSGILVNVNRWRGQINLADWTQKELDENLQEISVGSLKAQYVELFGDDSNGKPECILGGILVNGNQAWFFKLKGDKAVGMKQRDNFKKFIGSIRF